MICLILKRVTINSNNLNTINKLPLLTQTKNYFGFGRGSTGARTRKNFKPYPPQSKTKEVEYFGGKVKRFDEYQNLEREKFEALQYRKFENNYSTKLKTLNRALFDNLKNGLNYFTSEGIKAPVIHNKGKYSPKLNLSKSTLKFDYYEGNNVKIFRRLLGEEELLLDTTSKEFNNLKLKKIDTSDDNLTIAFIMLESGDNSGQLFIGSIKDNTYINHICIESHAFNFFLNEDGNRLFYTIMNNKLRPYKLMCYDIKTQNTVAILEDNDSQNFLDINISRDKKFLFINSNKLTQSQIHTIKTDFDYGRDKPILLQPFEEGLECFVDHFNDKFFILSNECSNFKLYTINDSIINDKINEGANLLKFKKELKLLGEDKIIMDVELFKNFIVLFCRSSLGSEIFYFNLNSKKLEKIGLPTELNSISPINNYDFNSNKLSFYYSTPLTPRTELNFNLELGKFIDFGLPYISGVASNDYIIKREFTNNGVPITLVHRNNLKLVEDGHPCLLINYGAYGVNLELDYRPEWMTLLNKGFIIALAHIRGGGELGPNWYSEGRALNRNQSINDLIEVADLLCSSGLTNSKKLIGFTWSAGAINLGAAVNRRPELFKGVVFRVPFLDPITSLMDEEQALTQVEKEEWGDVSNDLNSLKHLLTYAPYDNLPPMIRKTDPFPHTLLITADKDQIVPYWHPLKYLAKLRTILSREHRSAHFLITIEGKGHTDYLLNSQVRETILTSELVFILKCLDNTEKLNYV